MGIRCIHWVNVPAHLGVVLAVDSLSSSNKSERSPRRCLIVEHLDEVAANQMHAHAQDVRVKGPNFVTLYNGGSCAGVQYLAEMVCWCQSSHFATPVRRTRWVTNASHCKKSRSASQR